MYKTVLAGAAVAIAMSLGVVTAQAADTAFTCPAMTGDAKFAKIAQELVGASNSLDHPDKLNAAVDALGKAGASRAMVIDNLVNAYCPTVAANAALSTFQKSARIQHFAAVVTQRVYNLESADAIFLNVALPPTLVDAVNAKAKAAGVSAEEWIAGVVAQSIGGK